MPHLANYFSTLTPSPLNDLAATRKKVCIYGAGLGHREAPLDDPEWEVWALNLVVPLDSQRRWRADTWFDLHQRKAQSDDDLRWMQMCPVPFYVPDDLLDAVKYPMRFPLADIERHFQTRYWTCTFAYQIALVMYLNWRRAEEVMSTPGAFADVPTELPAAAEPAVRKSIVERMQRYTHIGLYGVELAYGSERERTFEWACTAYWIGRAQQSGIRICTPDNSLLRRHFARYGFEYTEEMEAVKQMERNQGGSDAELRSRADWQGDVGGR